MKSADIKALQREILLGFWKVHIFHHAADEAITGHWMMRELRRHGYDVSPGTIYPLFARLERHGWIECISDPERGSRERKEYVLTASGREALAFLKNQVEELYREVILNE